MPVHRKIDKKKKRPKNTVKRTGVTIVPDAPDKKPRTKAQKAKDRLARSDGHRTKTPLGHGRFKIDKRRPSKPELDRGEAQRAANTAEFLAERIRKGKLMNRGLKGKKSGWGGKYTKTRRDI